MKIKLFIPFISLLLAFSFSCRENAGSKTTDVSTIPQIKPKKQNVSQSKDYTIVKILKKIDKSHFPPIINQYLNGNPNIKVSYIDNSKIILSTGSGSNFYDLQVKLIENPDKKLIFFINGIKRDSLNFQSYFYVLEYDRGNFQNITLYVFPESVNQIIKLELESDLHYAHLGNFWAYLSGISHYALNFEFFGNVCIIKRCFLSTSNNTDNCKQFLRLTWNGSNFSFKLVDQLPSKSPLLSAKELDQVMRYSTFDDALANPKSVYILDLDGKGISTLPAQLVLLEKLQILVLNNNYLDSLPDMIGDLSHLQIIRAENNNIKYIPKSIGYLYYLEELDLANNKISWLPYEMANLKNLEKLNVSGNRLQVLAFDMSNMQHLVSIDISKNQFEKIPYQIFKLKNLIYLDLSNNPIKILPRELIDMKSLQYLIIKNTLIDTNQIKYLKVKRQDLQIIY